MTSQSTSAPARTDVPTVAYGGSQRRNYAGEIGVVVAFTADLDGVAYDVRVEGHTGMHTFRATHDAQRDRWNLAARIPGVDVFAAVCPVASPEHGADAIAAMYQSTPAPGSSLDAARAASGLAR